MGVFRGLGFESYRTNSFYHSPDYNEIENQRRRDIKIITVAKILHVSLLSGGIGFEKTEKQIKQTNRQTRPGYQEDYHKAKKCKLFQNTYILHLHRLKITQYIFINIRIYSLVYHSPCLTIDIQQNTRNQFNQLLHCNVLQILCGKLSKTCLTMLLFQFY